MTDAPTPRDAAVEIASHAAFGRLAGSVISHRMVIDFHAALRRAGYVVAPREPTTEQARADVEADDNRTGAETCKRIYRAMIAEGEKR